LKKILPFILLFLLVLPSMASAHSKMITSAPEASAVETASPERITMDFNTDIEALSTFKLFNEQNEQISIEQISVEGHTLTGSPVEPLANGAYNVEWSIIGADGHAITGSYSFSVDAPITDAEVETTPEAQIDETTPTEEPSQTVEPETSTETNPSDTTAPKNTGTTTMVFIVIGAVIVVVAVLAIIFASRKRK